MRGASRPDHANRQHTDGSGSPAPASRHSEAEARDLRNIEGVGILLFTDDGTLVDANDEFLRMFGYTREQVTSRTLTWRDLTPSEYVVVSEAQMAAVANTGRIGPYEKEYFRHDGSRLWMVFAGASLGDGTIVEYCIDISDRKRAEAALRASEERLRRLNEDLEARVRERTSQIDALFTRLVSAQEEERRRIARDIHDHLGQQMTALRMNLEALRAHAGGNHALVEHSERIERLAEELDRSIDFLTWQLRPAALDHLGLSAALRNLVASWSERFGIDAAFVCTGDDRVRLAPDVEANLYRVAQEALNNVVKHARAKHVNVLLGRNDDRTVLVIEDDGRGFDPAIGRDAYAGCGLGLINMRERATLAGGHLEIESGAPSGTSIIIRIPTTSPPSRPES